MPSSPIIGIILITIGMCLIIHYIIISEVVKCYRQIYCPPKNSDRRRKYVINTQRRVGQIARGGGSDRWSLACNDD